MSVPLPTPEGPVMTNTRAISATLLPRSVEPSGASAVEQRDQLASLALGKPADRLARRDAAVNEDLIDLHAPVLGNRQQHVEHLGGLHILRRVQQQRVDRAAAGLQ